MSELNQLIAEFHATLAKFEVIAARMEEREESTRVIAADPTMRDLPFPDGVIPPPLPEGKTRWIYRGNDFAAGNGVSANGRHVLFTDDDGVWNFSSQFSYPVHHIEAV